MFYPLKWLKRFNFGSKNTYLVYQRQINVSPKYWRKIKFYISRGLYPVKFYGGSVLKENKYKFGMFALTRKPFAIPEKKIRTKKR